MQKYIAVLLLLSIVLPSCGNKDKKKSNDFTTRTRYHTYETTRDVCVPAQEAQAIANQICSETSQVCLLVKYEQSPGTEASQVCLPSEREWYLEHEQACEKDVKTCVAKMKKTLDTCIEEKKHDPQDCNDKAEQQDLQDCNNNVEKACDKAEKACVATKWHEEDCEKAEKACIRAKSVADELMLSCEEAIANLRDIQFTDFYEIESKYS